MVPTETIAARRERPPYSTPLLRYVALHKSVAVQAALLSDTRKAREVAAVLLLQGFRPFGPVSLEAHACLTELAEQSSGSIGYKNIEEHATKLAERLGCERWDGETEAAWRWLTASQREPNATYAVVKRLGDEELDSLMRLLVIVCFGQQRLDRLETEPSLFTEVARDLGVDMRAYWTPDQEFLSYLRREQLEVVVRESGAGWHMGKLAGITKAKLVERLARYFERAADPAAQLTDNEQKGRTWLPECMCLAGPSQSQSD